MVLLVRDLSVVAWRNVRLREFISIMPRHIIRSWEGAIGFASASLMLRVVSFRHFLAGAAKVCPGFSAASARVHLGLV
jgi:hypothetical protein